MYSVRQLALSPNGTLSALKLLWKFKSGNTRAKENVGYSAVSPPVIGMRCAKL
jgi:hypothetical protein